ncbi:hypothetical protein CAPI_09490 [Corynebacterium capitovis DSM 44611]|nr:hypothetical protein CAPI_09490 [Corynebacterium capitovis DSM 44611]
MKHYVRLHYVAPDLGGELLNVAELHELSDTECTMIRMIELDPHEAITGAWADGKLVGQANEPSTVVPHPDTYREFEGITADPMSEDEFLALWAEARAKFPEL